MDKLSFEEIEFSIKKSAAPDIYPFFIELQDKNVLITEEEAKQIWKFLLMNIKCI